MKTRHQPGQSNLPKHARIYIIGGGRSGCAAARLALDAGYAATLVDKRPRAALTHLRDRSLNDLTLIRQSDTVPQIDIHAKDADLIVMSPGVPASIINNPDRLPIWSEVEFAYRFTEGKSQVIGVTGSNGKSTTTSIIDHLFTSLSAIASHWTAGNIGKPLCEYLVEEQALPDWIVLELSSYQLEHIDLFRANIALLLNLSPDHLSRYPGGVEEYYMTKRRLFETQHEQDAAIYYDDVVCDTLMSSLSNSNAPRRYTFGGAKQPLGDRRVAHITPQRIAIAPVDYPASQSHDETAANLRHINIERESLHLVGDHNALNMAAAILAVQLAFESDQDEKQCSALRHAAKCFSGLPHRMEHIRNLDEVNYYNDSKATNVGAVVASISGFSKPTLSKNVVLLLGGYDKGLSFLDLKPAIEATCKQVIFFGQAGPIIYDELTGGHVHPLMNPDHIYPTLRPAIDAAKGISQSGDAVVLSPACSSFDEFKNFEDRGHTFSQIVNSL